MKILITGATGFIGGHLMAELEKHWHQIVIHSHDIEATRKKIDSKYQIFGEDSELPEIDGVIHLAGEPIDQIWTKKVREKIYNSRVLGARKLIDQIVRQQLKIKFFISASAIGYYGSRGDEILNESSSSGSGFLASVCRDWEREVLERNDLDARKVVLRKAPVLGKDGGMLHEILAPFKLGLGAKLGDGKQWMSWIHIEDAITMYVRLVEDSSLKGIFVGCAPEPVTNAEFTKALAHTLHRPAVLTVPKFALNLILGEMAETVLTSARVIPRRFLDIEFPFQFGNIVPALFDLLSEGQKHGLKKSA